MDVTLPADRVGPDAKKSGTNRGVSRGHERSRALVEKSHQQVGEQDDVSSDGGIIEVDDAVARGVLEGAECAGEEMADGLTLARL